MFQARHGPDNDLIGQFSLRVNSADGLPQLLDAGVKRIDDLYGEALHEGRLQTDAGLSPTPPGMPRPQVTDTPDADDAADLPVVSEGSVAVQIQFDTPGAGAVAAGEAAVRGIPGVDSAVTTSLALGGVSIMRVSYAGSADALKAALVARGYQVFDSGHDAAHPPRAAAAAARPVRRRYDGGVARWTRSRCRSPGRRARATGSSSSRRPMRVPPTRWSIGAPGR